MANKLTQQIMDNNKLNMIMSVIILKIEIHFIGDINQLILHMQDEFLILLNYCKLHDSLVS